MRVTARVTPGARREKAEKSDDEYTISVREPAQGNAANDRVRAILASEFGVPPSRVRFISGMRGRKKVFEVDA